LLLRTILRQGLERRLGGRRGSGFVGHDGVLPKWAGIERAKIVVASGQGFQFPAADLRAVVRKAPAGESTRLREIPIRAET
jgi:hypothetical protein